MLVWVYFLVGGFEGVGVLTTINLRADSEHSQVMDNQWFPVKQNLSNDVSYLSVDFCHGFFCERKEHHQITTRKFSEIQCDFLQPNSNIVEKVNL